MNKLKLLFVAANPYRTVRLQIDEEMRSIVSKIRAAEYRDDIEVVSAWATRPDDLLQALNEHRPTIVHFSGHGQGANGIILVGPTGEPTLVATETLAELFYIVRDNLKLIILNACFSESQAQVLIDTIGCVVGMSDNILDETAIVFSGAFYRALGFGRSIQEAFDQGKVAVKLANLPGSEIPQLLFNQRVTPSTFYLIANSKIGNQTDPLQVDIGSISHPSEEVAIAEIRFSVTNTTQKIVKIVSMLLRIVEFASLPEAVHPIPAAPIDEYFLFARISPSRPEYELIDRHHEIREKTEGFFLKLDAEEGYRYILQIDVIWHILGETDEVSSSKQFQIDFPVRSPLGLLKLARARLKAKSDE